LSASSATSGISSTASIGPVTVMSHGQLMCDSRPGVGWTWIASIIPRNISRARLAAGDPPCRASRNIGNCFAN